MKLAIYGGTFDPVHHGHLILARDAMEREGFDRVVFVPCSRSPHKDGLPSASGRDRVAMLRRAVAGQPGFEVSDCEIRRGGVSYAVETAGWFRTKYPDAELCWLLGADQKAKLGLWHRVAELRRLVRFVFMRRGGRGGGRQVDISATEARERIRAGMPAIYLVPEKVADYIERKRLYR